MNFLKTNFKGIIFCILLAIPCDLIGKKFPIVGGAVIAILSGMLIGHFYKDKKSLDSGIRFTSKKILQFAVILLGFGMDLNVVMHTGKQSLPIIASTIFISLFIAFILSKLMNISKNISILVGVGSSICGGSAIAATAPIIDADDEEVAQAISVIFLFNVLAALIFPSLGAFLGFNHGAEAFGIFAGTAINDTSSVTAAATTWDNIYNLGAQTLDKAVTVKLTRTLAIIPITLFLAFLSSRQSGDKGKKVSIKHVFPFFILYFILAALITTVAVSYNIPIEVFKPLKELSKFCIVTAMLAIGLHADIVKLIKTGTKPILMGLLCWLGIIILTLFMQHILGIW